MPIQVTSSKGQRSCKLINIGTPKPVDAIADIIEAIKGLTFNIEVKINQVTYQPTVEPNRSQNLPPAKNNPSASQNLSSTKIDSTINQDSRPVANNLTTLDVNQDAPPAKNNPPMSQDLPDTKSDSPMMKNNTTMRQHLPDTKTDLPMIKNNTTMDQDQPPIKDEKTLGDIQSQTLVAPQPEVETDKMNTVAPLKINLKPKPKLVLKHLTVGEIYTKYCVAAGDENEPTVGYVAYDDDGFLQLGDKIKKISDEIEKAPQVKVLTNGDIVLAQSIDDNSWYRAIIEKVEGELGLVYFFDWGMREKVPRSRVRFLIYPDIGLVDHPPYAIKLKFVNTPTEVLDKVLSCDAQFRMMVESYDELSQCFETVVLDLIE